MCFWQAGKLSQYLQRQNLVFRWSVCASTLNRSCVLAGHFFYFASHKWDCNHNKDMHSAFVSWKVCLIKSSLHHIICLVCYYWKDSRSETEHACSSSMLVPALLNIHWTSIACNDIGVLTDFCLLFMHLWHWIVLALIDCGSPFCYICMMLHSSQSCTWILNMIHAHCFLDVSTASFLHKQLPSLRITTAITLFIALSWRQGCPYVECPCINCTGHSCWRYSQVPQSLPGSPCAARPPDCGVCCQRLPSLQFPGKLHALCWWSSPS